MECYLLKRKKSKDEQALSNLRATSDVFLIKAF